MSGPLARAALHLENIRFSHSIFALPFVVAGACLAAHDRARSVFPEPRTLALILAAAVAARTCAMAANRVLDAELDARNPRTAGRAIPSGRLTRGSVLALAVVSGAAFVAFAFLLSPLCGWISLPVLAVLVGYSLAKRVTSLSHLLLGLALGVSPAAAWLAVQGDFGGNVAVPVLLGLGVTAWVAGFDLIYACQDAEHDRRAGLRSIPARLGVDRALWVARALHVLAVGLFLATGTAAQLGVIYRASTIAILFLLSSEHWMIGPPFRLERVNRAFFTLNGWVGVAFLVGVVADLACIKR
jgi:4-hydroxybenzoate polyprenyltransferase